MPLLDEKFLSLKGLIATGEELDYVKSSED
jgi:hypothetical protein